MDDVIIEHHENFTAVYMYKRLAFMCVIGTIEQRKSIGEDRWVDLATNTADFD